MFHSKKSLGPVTLRNLPPELAKAIQEKAKKRGLSLNKTVIGLLQENIDSLNNKPQLYHDLDALSGVWTRQEAAAFEKALAAQRTIDPELWK